MSESRTRRLVLAGLVAGSVIVVFNAMNPVPHNGGDNSGYISLAHSLLTQGAYTETFDPLGGPHTKYPPVFPLLLAALIGLGARSWVALKGLSAVATVGFVAVTFLWAERRLGLWPALAVSAVLGLSSAVVYYSGWVLSDPVFVLATMGALYASERSDDGERWWPWVAIGLACLAFFTRSAGLPLVLALGAAFALRRDFRNLGVAAAVIGVPALWWWWRGRGVGVAAYGSEFWLVDPYQPGLGTIGVAGLVPRFFENLVAYVLDHGPAGVVGAGAPGLAAIGVVLTAAAIFGWSWSLRERRDVAELFFPLYAGLILLWPQVWAGDRFALPLYPLMFVYGAIAVRQLTRRLPGAATGALIGAATTVALLLPAGASWIDRTQEASACAAAAERGAFACYGPRIQGFADAAAWLGRALPEGSVVLSRKPRHFYLLSGMPSRTFAFAEDPAVHLALADEVGARYVLVDQWDGQATRFVGAAVRGHPEAFCFIRGFGPRDAPVAQALGILPPEARPAPVGDGTVRILPCPGSYLGPGAGEAQSSSDSGAIPLLEGLDS